MSTAHALGKGEASSKTCEESSHEGITGTVGVDEEVEVKLGHRVESDLTVESNDGRLGTLGEHHGTRASSRDLGHGTEAKSRLNKVTVPTLLLGKSLSLGLVGEDKVGVRESLVHLLREEVNEERGREVHGKNLAVLRGVLGHVVNSLRALRHGQEKAGDVVDLGLLNHSLHGLAEGVLVLVAVSGVEAGDHGALLLVHHNGTHTSGGLGGLVVVLGNTSILAGLLELGTEVILTDSAEETGGLLGLGHPLCNTDRVLSGTASDVLNVEVVYELLVDREVLLLSKDAVARLETVLIKDLLRAVSHDVKQGVADTKDAALSELLGGTRAIENLSLDHLAKQRATGNLNASVLSKAFCRS